MDNNKSLKKKILFIAYEKTEKFQLTSFSPMFTSSWFVKSVISFLSVLQLITSNLLKKGKRICNEITLNHWRPFSFISTSKKEHFSLFLFIHIFKSWKDDWFWRLIVIIKTNDPSFIFLKLGFWHRDMQKKNVFSCQLWFSGLSRSLFRMFWFGDKKNG